MHDERHEHHQNHGNGYEKSDLHFSAIAVFALIVLGLTVGALLVTIKIVRGFENRPSQAVAPIPAEMTQSEIVREPELEKDPVAERDAVLVPTKERLHSYGAVAETPDRVHIPVQEAIELLASGRVPYKRAGNESVEVPTLGPVKLQTMLETGEAK